MCPVVRSQMNLNVNVMIDFLRERKRTVGRLLSICQVSDGLVRVL